jgi:rhodanese-related sulfurtransferase
MQSIPTPQALKQRLDAKNPNDVLLDVRTPQEYQSGHIAGAKNFNVSTLSVLNEIQKLDKSKTYILYCKSGGRSKMASMVMSQSGLKIVNCQFGIMHLNPNDFKISY